MKFFRLAVVLAFAAGAFGCGICCRMTCRPACREEVDGIKLVNDLWVAMKDADVAAVEGMIADGFQAVHSDGANDREGELELIRNLALGDYTLTDLRITRQGPALIATYHVSVEETIEGRRLSSKPAARMSVFVRTPDGWKWLAHANLKSLDEKRD